MGDSGVAASRVRRLLAAALCAMGIAGSAEAGPSLVTGMPVSGTLSDAGGRAVFALPVTAGDYVEAALDSGTAPLTVRLLGPGGAPLRRLLDQSTGRGVFRFVAGAGPLALEVSGEAPGAYTLSLLRTVAADRQRPPSPAYTSPAVAELAAALERGDGTGAFWRRVEREGTPLVEPRGDGTVVLTFLVRGASRNVRLLGAPSADHDPLERLGASDVWYRSYVVPDTTRLAYRIAPDIPDVPGSDRDRRVAILATAQADPLNRHPWPADGPDRFNQQSTIELPAAPVQPGVTGADAPEGRVDTALFRSATLGNEREVAVYTPAGFDPERPDTVLLVLFDGREYRTRVPTPAILDRMIAEGRLPPVVAVFVANPDAAARARELAASPGFAAMLADELVPWVAARTGVMPQPARTVLAGSSFGGLTAVTAALARPDRFGNALAMSGSFWWHPEGTPPARREHVAGWVARNARLPVRLFLAAGLFEVGRDGTPGIVDTTRHLRDVLEAKGYDVIHREYAAAHDYFAWRGVLGDGMLALFGRD